MHFEFTVTGRPPPPTAQRLADRRVVILLHSLGLGGAERQAVLLAQVLNERHLCHVDLWSLCAGDWGRTEAHRIGVPVTVLDFGTPSTALGVLHMAVGVGRRLRAAKVDYVVPYLDLPNLLANLAWRFTAARGCLWNQRNTNPPAYHRGLERLAFRMTGSIVGNSRHVLVALEKRVGASIKPTFVIHNGVRLAEPRADRCTWRSRLKVNDATFVACMVANLSRFKDHETLVKAWRTVVSCSPVSRAADAPVLVLAGRHDEMASAIQQLAREIGIMEHLRLPGAVDDIGGILGAVDLGVLSSVSEGCPNAVLEYMAAGLPIVSTDLPCVREVLPEQNLDYLAEPKSSKALAGAVLSLIADRPARMRTAELNRRAAQALFCPERMVESMVGAITSSEGKPQS